MYDVVALGELLIDFASLDRDEDGYPTMKANPGGAPCSFLAALNAYGARTAFLGKVGEDAFGRLLLSTMAKAGVETRGICADPAVFTTLAFVTSLSTQVRGGIPSIPDKGTVLGYLEEHQEEL